MKKALPITTQEKEKIVKLLKEKRSIKDVIAISGRSKRALIKIAKERGIRMKRSPIQPDEEERIVTLLKERKNARQVARIVGRGSTTVLNVAANHSIALTHQSPENYAKRKIK